MARINPISAVNPPLRLPEDPELHPAILTRWADALEVRIRALEQRHANLTEQLKKQQIKYP